MYDLTICGTDSFSATTIEFVVASDKAKATLDYASVTIRKSALGEFALAMNNRGLRVEGASNLLIAGVA